MRLLPAGLPIRPAAPVRRQRAGGAGDAAQRQLRGLCLAGFHGRRVRAQRAGDRARLRGERRGVRGGLRGFRRSGGAVFARRRRFLPADAAPGHGGAVRRRGALRRGGLRLQPARLLARHSCRAEARRFLGVGARAARCLHAALSGRRWRRLRLRERAAVDVAPRLSPLHLLRISFVLCRHLRGDGLSLRLTAGARPIRC